MKRICIVITMLCLVVLFVGCGSAERRVTAAINEGKIYKGITLGEASTLLGKQRPNDISTDYPLIYSWSAEDNQILYMSFEADDKEEFEQKLKNREFVLPEEIARYDEQTGFPVMTPNEAEVWGAWIESHQATSAWILHEGNREEILFD